MATDNSWRRAEVNPNSIWECYSTVLHILGLDFNRLSWCDRESIISVIEVRGHIIRDFLA